MTQPVEIDRSARDSRIKRGKQRPGARLRLIPKLTPEERSSPPTIWHGDPNMMSPAFTALSDWPTDADFAPLISAALAAGNSEAADQLRRDCDYCASMRRKIRRAAINSRHKS